MDYILFKLREYSRLEHCSNIFLPSLCVCVRVFSHVQLFANIWTVVHKDLLSMGFFRKDYWSGLPLPSPGIFLTQGSNPSVFHLLHLQVGSLPLVLSLPSLASQKYSSLLPYIGLGSMFPLVIAILTNVIKKCLSSICVVGHLWLCFGHGNTSPFLGP